MRSFILGLVLVVFASSPVLASGRCKNGNCRVGQPTRVYSIPTVGKTTYTIENPSVVRPSASYTLERPACKDGKCRLNK